MPSNHSAGAPIKALRDAEKALNKGEWPTVNPEWQEIARLSFHLKDKPRFSIMIPFAYVVDAAGEIGYLKFDLVESKTRLLAHHPRHAFCSTFSAEFENSVRQAWTFAARNWYGRWRLVKKNARRGKDCIASAMGESASGAAAYGLGCLARGQKWDRGVMVLARLDAQSWLEAVDSIPAKVEAIINNARQIHTIVVVEQNREEAIAELARLNQTFDLETQAGKPYQPDPNDLCCIRLHRGLERRLRSFIAFTRFGRP